MVASLNKKNLFIGSSGSCCFKLAGGQELLVEMEDRTIIEELTRRGLWDHVKEHARIGTSFALPDGRYDSADVFVWFGNQQDGGFVWFSIPGTDIQSDVAQGLIHYLSAALFTPGCKGRWEEVQHV